MKKSRIISLLLVSAAIEVSCTTNDIYEPVSAEETGISAQEETVNFIFNVTPDTDTKTSVESSGSNPKVSWVAGDQIYVLPEISVTGSGSTVTLESADISADDSSIASFKVKTNARSTYYDALYPASALLTFIGVQKQMVATIPHEQDGSFADSHISVSRSARVDDETFSFHFSNVTNFIQFTLESTEYETIVLTGNNGEALSGTTVLDVSTNPATATPYTQGTGLTYTDVRVNINGTPGTYYIGILPTNFQRGFTLRFLKEGETSSKKVISVTKSADFSGRNKIIDLGAIDGRIEDEYIDSALPGIFTVNSNGKQVRFACGNLQCVKNGADWSGCTWQFAPTQYETVETSGQDVGTDYADATIQTLFGWGDVTHKTSTSGPKYSWPSSGDAWGSKIDNKGTWRTLTGGPGSEWEYLLKTRHMTNDKPRFTNVRNGVTIDGRTYNGLFIYPDDYVGEEIVNRGSDNTWEKINADGIVFLPTSTGRYGSNVNPGGNGMYWSSTRMNQYYAYALFFTEGNYWVEPDWALDPYFGECVRLVTDCGNAEGIFIGNVEGNNVFIKEANYGAVSREEKGTAFTKDALPMTWKNNLALPTEAEMLYLKSLPHTESEDGTTWKINGNQLFIPYTNEVNGGKESRLWLSDKEHYFFFHSSGNSGSVAAYEVVNQEFYVRLVERNKL